MAAHAEPSRSGRGVSMRSSSGLLQLVCVLQIASVLSTAAASSSIGGGGLNTPCRSAPSPHTSPSSQLQESLQPQSQRHDCIHSQRQHYHTSPSYGQLTRRDCIELVVKSHRRRSNLRKCNNGSNDDDNESSYSFPDEGHDISKAAVHGSYCYNNSRGRARTFSLSSSSSSSSAGALTYLVNNKRVIARKRQRPNINKTIGSSSSRSRSTVSSKSLTDNLSDLCAFMHVAGSGGVAVTSSTSHNTCGNSQSHISETTMPVGCSLLANKKRAGMGAARDNMDMMSHHPLATSTSLSVVGLGGDNNDADAFTQTLTFFRWMLLGNFHMTEEYLNSKVRAMEAMKEKILDFRADEYAIRVGPGVTEIPSITTTTLQATSSPTSQSPTTPGNRRKLRLPLPRGLLNLIASAFRSAATVVVARARAHRSTFPSQAPSSADSVNPSSSTTTTTTTSSSSEPKSYSSGSAAYQGLTDDYYTARTWGTVPRAMGGMRTGLLDTYRNDASSSSSSSASTSSATRLGEVEEAGNPLFARLMSSFFNNRITQSATAVEGLKVMIGAQSNRKALSGNLQILAIKWQSLTLPQIQCSGSADMHITGLDLKMMSLIRLGFDAFRRPFEISGYWCFTTNDMIASPLVRRMVQHMIAQGFRSVQGNFSTSLDGSNAWNSQVTIFRVSISRGKINVEGELSQAKFKMPFKLRTSVDARPGGHIVFMKDSEMIWDNVGGSLQLPLLPLQSCNIDIGDNARIEHISIIGDRLCLRGRVVLSPLPPLMVASVARSPGTVRYDVSENLSICFGAWLDSMCAKAWWLGGKKRKATV